MSTSESSSYANLTENRSSRRPIRVAALIEASTVTGPARNLLEFASGSRAAGTANIEVVTFVRGEASPDRAENAFLAAVSDRKVDAHKIHENGRLDFRILRSLAATVNNIAPDIVQTHGVKSHFLISLLRTSGAVRFPWLAFHHGYTADGFATRVYNHLDRWSLPRADRVVTVCTPFAEMLARKGVLRENIEVLPNSIQPTAPSSLTDVEELRQRLQILPNEKVLLAVGRFSAEKGHDDLLQAVAILRERHAALPIRLVLVGDGPLRKTLESKVAALDLKTAVIFAGHQGNLALYYAMADLFILPSHSEGSPNVLLEAMAARLPIVSTSVGGVPDTVTNEDSALTVPARQPLQLMLAMERLLSDAELSSRLRKRALERVSSDFQTGNYRESLLGIYRRVLPSNRP